MNIRPDGFVSFPGKMPFEDRVLEYLTGHPDKTAEDCSRDLGIGVHAVWAACVSLAIKGLVSWDADDEGGAA